MKRGAFLVLATLVLSTVVHGSRMLSQQPDATTLDPALPEDQATAWDGYVVNGTQTVCNHVLRFMMINIFIPMPEKACPMRRPSH